MSRLQDWPQRLREYFDARRDMPFDWSANSCVGFAAGAVQAMTDEPPELPEIGSAQQAAVLLAERSLRDRVTDAYGPEIHPAYAQRGDLVLIDIAGRESLGICVGVEAAGPGTDGLLTVPMETAVAAWRV